MSVSTSRLTKELKELLGARTNADVLRRVTELQARPSPTPEALVIAVQWRPGEQEAGVMVLSGGDPPITLMAEALRQGEAMVLAKMERIAAQARSESARLRAELQGWKEKAEAKDSN